MISSVFAMSIMKWIILKAFVWLLSAFIPLTSCENHTVRDITKCPYPKLALDGSDVLSTTIQDKFIGVTEVKFPGIMGPLNEKLICKIKCIDGIWVGPLCSSSEGGRFQPLLRECSYNGDYQHLLITYKDRMIKNATNFIHGSTIAARCEPFGLYKIKGRRSSKCQNGDWVPKLPECIPTLLISSFIEDAPPAIKYMVVSGSANVEPNGELFVYTGSTIHLDCIVVENLGKPHWTWTKPFARYKTAWVEEEGINLTHYRLELKQMSVQDDDLYTCSTATARTHTVSIKVVSADCPMYNVSDDKLLRNDEGTKLGQTSTFSCKPGYRLEGSSSITCTGSGRWSGEAGRCVGVACAPLAWVGRRLLLGRYEPWPGGVATFTCPFGYRLVGSALLRCTLDARWDHTLPNCVLNYCITPAVPEHGNLLKNPSSAASKHSVGDLLIYRCENKYKVVGEASIICGESGLWSHPPPECVPAEATETPDVFYFENATLLPYK